MVNHLKMTIAGCCCIFDLNEPVCLACINCRQQYINFINDFLKLSIHTALDDIVPPLSQKLDIVPFIHLYPIRVSGLSSLYFCRSEDTRANVGALEFGGSLEDIPLIQSPTGRQPQLKARSNSE